MLQPVISPALVNEASTENFFDYKQLDVLHYRVFCGELSDLDCSRKHLINTFSPNSYGLALKDPAFKKALQETDVLLLDGMGIAIGSILLHGRNIKKIAGQDCFDYFMQRANEQAWKVFFLGSSQKTLEKIFTRTNKEYPNIRVFGYSPPFKNSFSQIENETMVEAINACKPNILFIGMTAPKQEKWAHQHYRLLDVQITATIGNVFDWYAGNSKRPAPIWIRLRLEWFIRLFLRPEIFRRNTRNQFAFLQDLFLHVTYLKRLKN